MPRRRKKTEVLLTKGDSFHVMHPQDGELAIKGAAHHALNVGTRVAEQAPGPVTLTIERRSLFGPAATIFRIERYENGAVSAFTVDGQD
jgi:hypothetical protein